MILKPRAFSIILSLSLIFPLAARILKFIWRRKLNAIKNIAYCKIIPDISNFSPNNMIEIMGQNTKNKIEKTNENTKKFLKKILFTHFIFSFSFFAIISEKTGNKNANIGPIRTNGIEIILR